MQVGELLLEASKRSRKGQLLFVYTRDPGAMRARRGASVEMFNAVLGTKVVDLGHSAIVALRPEDVLLALAACARMEVSL